VKVLNPLNFWVGSIAYHKFSYSCDTLNISAIWVSLLLKYDLMLVIGFQVIFSASIVGTAIKSMIIWQLNAPSISFQYWFSEHLGDKL